MTKLRSPIVWFGGKGRMTASLLPLLPAHETYVEPFGGGASLLLAKAPAAVEVYNDLDSGLVQFFRTLRDPELFARFHSLASLTPYSRQEYKECAASWEQEQDPAVQAYKWFVVARMSFSGRFASSISMNVGSSSRGMASTCSRWLSILEQLPAIAHRLQRVQIEHLDFARVLQNYDTPQTLFYCDPPYVAATRSGGRYRHDFSDADHERLVDALLSLQGMVVCSGYQAPVHARLEAAGWQRRDFATCCYAAGRTRHTGILGPGSGRSRQPRLESVWLCPRTLKRLRTSPETPRSNAWPA